MTLSAWWLLPLAVPVLLLGEFLVRRVRWLSKVDMPVPVVGGFVVAIVVLFVNLIGHSLKVNTDVSARGWTWLITAEPLWRTRPATPIFLVFSTMFFTCVGLNASWRVARRGSWMLLILLAVATALAIVQNAVGVSLAKLLHVSPYVGLLCGSLALTGGPSTAIGFAPEFAKAGFAEAPVVGAAAAMFGIVAGSLLGGPLGGQLIRRKKLNVPSVPSNETTGASAAEKSPRRGIVSQTREFASLGRTALLHLIVLLLCVKAGAWMSYALVSMGAKFPVYIGAMLVAIIVRNVLDALDVKLLDTEVINLMGAIALGLFLAMAMSSLNLIQLRALAGPMLLILVVQTLIVIGFAWWVTFNLTGRDYEAAVTSAGHVGFGLGITPNAVATMDVLTSKFGPAPRAFLTVTLVGGFLIDFANSALNAIWMNFLK